MCSLPHYEWWPSFRISLICLIVSKICFVLLGKALSILSIHPLVDANSMLIICDGQPTVHKLHFTTVQIYLPCVVVLITTRFSFEGFLSFLFTLNLKYMSKAVCPMDIGRQFCLVIHAMPLLRTMGFQLELYIHAVFFACGTIIWFLFVKA